MNNLELKTRLIDILNRGDDVSDTEIQYFINSAIRILEKWNIFRGMEDSTTLTLEGITNKFCYSSLPSDFKKFKHIHQLTPEFLSFIQLLETDEAYNIYHTIDTSTTILPDFEAIAIVDNNAIFFPGTSVSSINSIENPNTFNLVYDKFMTELSADGDENYFTIHAPELIIQMASIIAYVEKLNEYDTAQTKFNLLSPMITTFVSSEYGDNISKSTLSMGELMRAIKALNSSSTGQ